MSVYVNFILMHVSDLHTISVYSLSGDLSAHRAWARLTHVYATKVEQLQLNPSNNDVDYDVAMTFCVLCFN